MCFEHASQRVSVGLLGSFSLRHGGQPIALTPAEQRLVAFLALDGRPRRRPYVAGRLFPDVAEDKAHGRLRTAIWRCRHQAGEHLLHVRPTELSLCPAASVDVRNVLARIDLLDPKNPQVSAADLSHDLLDGWYDEWVVPFRDQFRHDRLRALDALAWSLLDLGRRAEALRAGLAAVAAEPLRESARAAVIAVHLADGNLAEAVRQYSAYAALLEDELGATPSAALARALPHLRRR